MVDNILKTDNILYRQTIFCTDRQCFVEMDSICTEIQYFVQTDNVLYRWTIFCTDRQYFVQKDNLLYR